MATPDADPDIRNLLELLPVPGEPGKERAVAELVRGKLRALGVPEASMVFDTANRRSEIGGEVGNLIVRLDGRRGGVRRLMSTHLDTVPGAVGSRPRLALDRVVNDAPGRCLGGDARAGCAALLAAARRLLELRGEHAPWTLVFFVQEEIGLVGARWLDLELLGLPRPALGFNFDGGPVREVTNRVIGAERLHVEVTGVAAHTMYTPRGISAAEVLCRAAAECMAAGWHGVVEKPEGKGLANLGVLRGGTGSNVVMPGLYALLEARSFDRAFRGRILEAWRAALGAAAERASAERPDAAGRAAVSFRPGPVYDPCDLPPGHPAVEAARAAIRSLGVEPVLVDDWGGQDSAWTTAHGIPSVGLGFGGCLAHSPEEYVDVPEFRLGCRLAAALAGSPADG